MQRFRTSRKKPGRGPARWTWVELLMLLAAMLMIVFPLYAEAYRWVNPLIAPAAPRQNNSGDLLQQRATQTPTGPTTVPTTAATTVPTTRPSTVPTTGPTTVPTTGPTTVPTTGPTTVPTTVPTTGGPTTPPTTVPTTGPTTAPTTGPTTTPTNTAIPGTPTATLTQVAGEPPLRLFKSASTAQLLPGQQFEYTLSVFSNSATATNVEVRDLIDNQLQIVRATATKGSCSVAAPTVTCTVPVANNQPVTIHIIVKVGGATQPGRVSNQASAQDGRGFTAASDTVTVDVIDDTGAPTSVLPTVTDGPSPTATTEPTIGPSPTTGGGGTNPTATATKTSGGGGGGGGGGGAPQPTSPLLPPLPPTPRPGAARPTARPAPRATVAPAAASSTAAAAASATATSAPTATPLSTYFRMASDWGSAFVGQEINYIIAFRNTQQSGDLKNVRITSAMPDNLEILGQKSDNGDPKRQGNLITLNLASLDAQKGVEIAIRAKIKAGVEVGTRLVSQAEATYDSLAAPLQSNVVTVLIVGEQLGPVVQAATPGSTATATSTASPTSGATAATATTAPTSAPTARPTAAPKPSAPELPATSTGVPLSGFALLGLTLLLRTVRLHREQTRI